MRCVRGRHAGLKRHTRLSRKPMIRVEAGFFMGYIDDEQHVLGSIGNGILPAVQKMIKLRMEHASA
jgi:hypothetical protein